MRLKNYLPILDWLANYKRNQLSGDIASGITIGVMLVPQGMAYALIAGLPPVYGLYAAITPQIVYALLGTSRQLAVGPVAMDSLLVAAGVSLIAQEGTEAYLAYAILLALMVGVFQMLLGFFRMGFVTNLLAKPVISGFTSAAAIIIALNQLKHLAGYEIVKSSNAFVLLLDAFSKVGDLHVLSLFIGLMGLLIIFGTKKLIPKVPGALLAVISGVVLVSAFGLESEGVKIVGDVPEGLPSLIVPDIQWSTISQLIPLSVTIAIVGFMEAFSVSKAIEEKKRDHVVKPNQELIALGAANAVGSFFQSFPVTGGFSRSAVNYETGANTQLVSFVSAAVIGLTLLFLTPLFYYLPNAILAAIILMAVIGLVDTRYAYSLWFSNKIEFFILIFTFLLTLNFGMVPGIISGIAMSILLLLYRLGYPHIALLGRVPGHHEFRNINRFKDLERWDDLLIMRMDGPLTFVNIQYFKDYLLSQLSKRSREPKAVLLDAGPMSHLDATAAQGLKDLLMSFQERGIGFYLADVVGPVRDQLHKSGLIDFIGSKNIFLDLNDIVEFLVEDQENIHYQAATQTGEFKT